jgi:hypothetical protein
MSPSILGFQAPLLRGVAQQLQLPSVSAIARQPTSHEVYRITVHYFNGRACNSVATLRRVSTGSIVLETAYQRALGNKALVHPIDSGRYAEFVKALKGIQFDHMGDQPNLPEYNSTDLWLVERAAGTFSHGVILAPELARDSHARLVNAVKNGLPEALRLIK